MGKLKGKLLTTISRAQRILYYKKLWGVAKGSSSLQFNQLPLAGKEIFNAQNIAECLAVPESRVTYYYFSAGTTGNPKMIPFTKHEWDVRSLYRKKCYEVAGITRSNRVAVLLPFGPWVAGPSAQSALLTLGCIVFPMGLLSEIKEILGWFSIFQRHAIDTIVTTPSFAQRLAYINDTRRQKIFFKKIITSGEYLGEALRKRLYSSFRATVYSSYASSEAFIGIECSRHQGFHYDPTRIMIETLDQKTQKQTSGVGIVTITPFDAEAVPLIRYPMGDLAQLEHKKCSCGLNWPRILWKGRTQEIFEVAGGVKIHFYQIREALLRSSVLISRCRVQVFDTPMSGSSLIFHLWSSDRVREKKKTEEGIRDTLIYMSMDVADVVYHKLVSLEVTLHHELDSRRAIKMKVEIQDERSHT